MTDLFSPLQAGDLTLPNRVWMAPLTRTRNDPGHVPNALMAEYYAQRASAGLVITECTMVCEGTSAFMADPGIYNDAQVAAWKQVTDAVHAKGGRIFMQIWHGGRAAHPAMNAGQPNVSASAIAIDGSVNTPQGKLPNATPQALTESEIQSVVQSFARGASSAIAAGFDGVELHGAEWVPDRPVFAESANQRTDRYGGSLENRARFLMEVLDAVCNAIGSGRVGLRLSPLNSYNSMKDSDPIGLTAYLAERLNGLKLAYLHLMRADFFQQQHGDVMSVAREKYQGVLVGNMGYTPEEAQAAVQQGKLDAVAFGTAFLANPDLPARIRAGAALNAPDSSTFYTPGPKGYTDYPALPA